LSLSITSFHIIHLLRILIIPFSFSTLFFFYCYGDHRDLHSFPTRRSSDLGLRHRYPTGYEALAEVSLAIRPGEFVALVGRNGSGKTTLAKHLNGLLEPTEGAVRLEGRDLRGLALEELAQRVGYVFQDPDHQ